MSGYLVNMGSYIPGVWRLSKAGMRTMRGRKMRDALVASKFPFRTRLVLTLNGEDHANLGPEEQIAKLWASWARLRKIWARGRKDQRGQVRTFDPEFLVGVHDDREKHFHLDICMDTFIPKKLLEHMAVQAGFGPIKRIMGITGQPGSAEWKQAVRYSLKYSLKGDLRRVGRRRYVSMSKGVRAVLRAFLESKKGQSGRQWRYMSKETVAAINEAVPVEIFNVGFRSAGVVGECHLSHTSRFLNLDPEKLVQARENLKWLLPKRPRGEKPSSSPVAPDQIPLFKREPS